MNRIICTLFVLHLFSLTSWSMEVPDLSIFAGNNSGWMSRPVLPSQSDIYKSFLNISDGEWPYVKAIWSVLLSNQYSAAPRRARVTKQDIIESCVQYFKVTKGGPERSAEIDTAILKSLLGKPENIYAGRKQLNDSYPQVLEFVYEADSKLAVAPKDFLLGNKLTVHRWDPITAIAPLAMSVDSIAIVQTWLKNGLDVDQKFPEYQGATLLHLAARFGTIPMINMLVKNAGASFDVLDDALKTPLELMKELRSSGALAVCELAKKARAVHARSSSSLSHTERTSRSVPDFSEFGWAPKARVEGTVNESVDSSRLRTVQYIPAEPREAAQAFADHTDLNETRMNVNYKYLIETLIVPPPLAETSAKQKTPEHPRESFSFKQVSQSFNYEELYETGKALTGVLHYRLLSTRPIVSPRDYLRTTFVLAGRGANAWVPEETDGGRVILVVTKDSDYAAWNWLGKNRDVMIIDDLWDQTGRPISYLDLGLVTSRRLAIMHLAQHYGLSHFMMLDDNIEHWYMSNNLPNPPTNWAQTYDLFQNAARRNNSTVLSAQNLNYRMLDVSLKSPTVVVNKDRQAAKVFYINMQSISDSFQERKQKHLSWLFPQKLDVCGEDIFFQSCLRYLKLAVDSISSGTLAYSRWESDRHAALRTVVPFTYWKAPNIPSMFAPDYYHRATKRMTAIYEEAIQSIEDENSKFKNANLPALTAKVSENRNAKENGSIVEKRKRTPSDFAQRQNIDPNTGAARKKRKRVEKLVVAQGGDSIPFLKSRLASIYRSTIISIFNRNPALSDTSRGTPFREHQLQAIMDFIDHLHTNSKTGIFEYPTGAGKTQVIFALLAFALKTPDVKNKHIAILAPTVELVEQTYDVIKRFNQVMAPFGLSIPVAEKVTKVSTGNVPQNHLPHNFDFLGRKPQVLIFCNKSFENLMKHYPQFYDLFSILFIDEFHAMPDHQLREITNTAKRKEMFVLGFSATPKERDRFFEDTISYLSIEDAVARKILCPWKNMSLGEWTRDLYDFLWPDLARSLKVTRHPNGKAISETKTLIYVANAIEAEAMANILRAHSIKAEAYTHVKSKEEQKNLLRRFALTNASEYQIDTLVAIHMLGMGFDGRVETSILAKTVGSYEIAVQVRGRALRLDPLNPDKIALFIAPDQTFIDFDLKSPFDTDDSVVPLLYAPVRKSEEIGVPVGTEFEEEEEYEEDEEEEEEDQPLNKVRLPLFSSPKGKEKAEEEEEKEKETFLDAPVPPTWAFEKFLHDW